MGWYFQGQLLCNGYDHGFLWPRMYWYYIVQRDFIIQLDRMTVSQTVTCYSKLSICGSGPRTYNFVMIYSDSKVNQTPRDLNSTLHEKGVLCGGKKGIVHWLQEVKCDTRFSHEFTEGRRHNSSIFEIQTDERNLWPASPYYRLGWADSQDWKQASHMESLIACYGTWLLALVYVMPPSVLKNLGNMSMSLSR